MEMHVRFVGGQELVFVTNVPLDIHFRDGDSMIELRNANGVVGIFKPNSIQAIYKWCDK